MDTTLAKGLALLEWLARQHRPSRLADVARAFGLARSSAHRHLQTLVECGWVAQDEHSAYRAGIKLVELGALVASTADLKTTLRPALHALWRASGETIHLTVLDGAEVLYVDKFDSSLPVAAYSQVGGRAPAYCVASGKALLAAAGLDAGALRARLGTLVAHTPHTVTDFDALAAELVAARARGHAINREEWREGVCGLGAPVFDAGGHAVATVVRSVRSMRFGRERARQQETALIECAWSCSQALGFHPPAPAATPGTRTMRRTA